jgi:4-hydroxybenzoate polyprenyltransferase
MRRMNWTHLKTRLLVYEELMRLNMVGGWLLLWPLMWALWLAAQGRPDIGWVLIFAAGAILMHGAGCIINDYADRNFDGHVRRTRTRPFVTRAVSAPEAFTLMAGVCLLCFLMILPRLTLLLCGLTALAVAVAFTYPFAKRFFPLPQLWLGLAFGLGIPMAYAAQSGEVPTDAWLLLLANIFWVLAYDTEYAMVDRSDDLAIGICTSAITFGRHEVRVIMCCYALALALIAWVGLHAGLGGIFLGALLVAIALALHHYRLIRRRDEAGCLKAFKQNNWVGLVIFSGIALDYLL